MTTYHHARTKVRKLLVAKPDLRIRRRLYCCTAFQVLSTMFREPIPQLAEEFHVNAPD